MKIKQIKSIAQCFWVIVGVILLSGYWMMVNVQRVAASPGDPIVNTATLTSDSSDATLTNNSAALCLLEGSSAESLLNQAIITSDSPETQPVNNIGALCLVVTQPNLLISKSGPANATQGANFSYTLVVTNTGTAATSSVITVTDSLPAGLSFVGGSGGGFTCAASGQNVTCTSSSVIAANNGTATISLTVNPTTTGVKSNNASVSGGGDNSAATSNTVNTTVSSSISGVEYKLVYNATLNRYEVWMRATATPSAPKTTGTAQVTIKAPHVLGSGIFTPTNVTAQVADTSWAVNSRTDGPAVDMSADYISFALDFPTGNHGAINWQAGQEILMFTFQNGGVCAGAVSLMENNDPFNVAPNNPGQQIDVFGLGSDPGNDFLGNYNLGQADCDRDGDGVVNSSDLDDDSDGLLDSVEGALTVDSDGDGLPDALDLDSDGDGIPDNIEAQSTAGYVAPSGSDSDGDGIDNAYEGAGNAGLTPVNSDGADNPDDKDNDSDNAQGDDTAEAGLTKSNTDADKDGLDDGIDSNDSTFGPVNAGVTNPATVYPNTNSSGDVDYRDAITAASIVTLPMKLFLNGAYSGSGLMRDDLRSRGLLPVTSPYTQAVASVHANVFTISGTQAIVDWVLVEVRNSATPATVVVRQAALLQRDGDVVALNGSSVLTATLAYGNYYVSVRHRNHLGAMTGASVALSNNTPLIDFTNMSATYGTQAQRFAGGVYQLWAGDTNGNGQVIGAGPGNELNPILGLVLAAPGNAEHNRNYIVVGYSNADVNLDGQAIAAGPGNDINYIYNGVFLHSGNTNTAANYIVQQQLP